jgi:DNA repair protein RadC
LKKIPLLYIFFSRKIKIHAIFLQKVNNNRGMVHSKKSKHAIMDDDCKKNNFTHEELEKINQQEASFFLNQKIPIQNLENSAFNPLKWPQNTQIQTLWRKMAPPLPFTEEEAFFLKKYSESQDMIQTDVEIQRENDVQKKISQEHLHHEFFHFFTSPKKQFNQKNALHTEPVEKDPHHKSINQKKKIIHPRKNNTHSHENDKKNDFSVLNHSQTLSSYDIFSKKNIHEACHFSFQDSKKEFDPSLHVNTEASHLKSNLNIVPTSHVDSETSQFIKFLSSDIIASHGSTEALKINDEKSLKKIILPQEIQNPIHHTNDLNTKEPVFQIDMASKTEHHLQPMIQSPIRLQHSKKKSLKENQKIQQKETLKMIPLPCNQNYLEEFFYGHRQRLRQRFLASSEALLDYELLEMLLCLAQPRGDMKPLAKTLMKHFGGLPQIFSAEIVSLKHIKGLGNASLVAFKVIIEILRRFLKEELKKQPLLNNVEKVLEYCYVIMAYLEIEQFRILFLDRKNHLIQDIVHQEGTLDRTALYPRELIKMALALNAGGLILVHNHPSGDPTPSTADIQATTMIKSALLQVEIHLLDHLIIAKHGTFSFRDGGLI